MAKAIFSTWNDKVLDGRYNGTTYSAEEVGLPLTYGEDKEFKAIFGWNGIVLTDDSSNIVSLAADYFNTVALIACGECNVGYNGVHLIKTILDNFVAGTAVPADIARLKECIEGVSINTKCSFCSSAVKPIADCLRYFSAEFEAAAEAHAPYAPSNGLLNVTAPCIEACPIHQDVPGYIGHIKNHNYDEAINLIKRNNPLPGCTGRACMAFCEKNCIRNEIDAPVSIRKLKRVAYDYGTPNELVVEKKKKEEVAIIGAGPAGIAAAKRLLSLGYNVVAYDLNNVCGGMMNDGIPSYRLPRDIIKADFDEMIALGAEYRVATPVRDIEDISSHYKATIICTGAYLSKSNGIEGWTEGENDMLQGVRYLKSINNKKSMELKNSVLVVGGGNTAVDCARTALRAGSRDVTIIYRRSRTEMPANAEEIDEAEIEGVKLDLLALPIKIEVEENGMKKVTCQKMQLGEPDESGRRRPVPVPGSEYVINCDMILSAIGEKPDVAFLNNKVELTDWGTIKTDKNGATSMKGVFAAGDCVNGPASIVEAMASGKRAAIGAVMYMDGKTTVSNEKEEVFEPFHKEFLKHKLDNTYNYARERQHARMIERNVLLDNFNEVEQVLTKRQAVAEADRCLKCYKVILVTRN